MTALIEVGRCLKQLDVCNVSDRQHVRNVFKFCFVLLEICDEFRAYYFQIIAVQHAIELLLQSYLHITYSLYRRNNVATICVVIQMFG